MAENKERNAGVTKAVIPRYHYSHAGHKQFPSDLLTLSSYRLHCVVEWFLYVGMSTILVWRQTRRVLSNPWLDKRLVALGSAVESEICTSWCGFVLFTD